jgi:Ala-tRNA(Pro) deacylase
MKIDEMLTNRHVPFQTIHHAPAFTANRMAETLHVSGHEVAKPVLLRTGRGYVLVVVPANRQVDMQRIREWLGNVPVEMASEDEMDHLFPNCERGAIPPFGSVYHLHTLVDDALAEDKEIVFQTETHDEAIRMTYHDYEGVEHPLRGDFTYHSSSS